MRRGRPFKHDPTPEQWEVIEQALRAGNPAPVPTVKGGTVDTEHTNITLGPTEIQVRQLLGERPDGVTESAYLYAVREVVDTVDARREAFAQMATGRATR